MHHDGRVLGVIRAVFPVKIHVKAFGRWWRTLVVSGGVAFWEAVCVSHRLDLTNVGGLEVGTDVESSP
jgi:hypothetical protein